MYTFGKIALSFQCHTIMAYNFDLIYQDHAVKLRFYVMNFKGDWKYLQQLFNFRKNPSTEKVVSMAITYVCSICVYTNQYIFIYSYMFII